mgnify:FL=1
MSEDGSASWNLRVYGILVENSKVLLSRETYPGFEGTMTKLPGGGILLGEGPLDALRREFEEEVGLRISSADIFHVPGGYHQSHFDGSQVVSLYYLVTRSLDQIPRQMNSETVDGVAIYQEFFWSPIQDIEPSQMTWKTDREAVEILVKKFDQATSN